jgi:hypothetical protein
VCTGAVVVVTRARWAIVVVVGRTWRATVVAVALVVDVCGVVVVGFCFRGARVVVGNADVVVLVFAFVVGTGGVVVVVP